MEAGVGRAGAPAPPAAKEGHAWLDWAAPLAAMALHLVAVLVAWRVWGLDVAADPARASWDYFWQTLPAEQLRGDLLEALRGLHTQPPLYNLWGALFLRTAGEEPLQALAWANIAMATLVAGMQYAIGRALGLARIAATILSLALALLPSLLLYEVYPFYELLSLFLLTVGVWGFARRRLGGGDGWLALGVAGFVGLSLTRTSFHLLLPVAAAALALLASTRPRRMALWAALLLLPLLLWSGKNLVYSGFFGASSWGGMNLWRVAAADYSADELAALAKTGVISQMAAAVPAFSRPTAYAAWGFVAQGQVPAALADDLNNPLMIDVARQYGRDALALLGHDPARWLKTVGRAYTRFHRPASSYDHLEANRLRLPQWVTATEETIHLRPWLARYGSVTFFVYPLALLGFLLWMVLRLRAGESFAAFVRAEPAAVLAVGLLLYVALVSSFFEYGENERFRFVVEPLLWLFAAGTGANLRGLRRARRHSS